MRYTRIIYIVRSCHLRDEPLFVEGGGGGSVESNYFFFFDVNGVSARRKAKHEYTCAVSFYHAETL